MGGLWASEHTGPELRVNTTTSDNQQNSSVAVAANGVSVVVWQSYSQDGSGDGIYAQRYKRGDECWLAVAHGYVEGWTGRVPAGKSPTCTLSLELLSLA